MGICISAEPDKAYKEVPCFIDNGAYMAYTRGMPWSAKRFDDLLEKCWRCGLSSDFIVAPDIVGGGIDSLNFSLSFFQSLRPGRIALAVQDGMTPNDIDAIGEYNLSLVNTIFVGGTVPWKWQTASDWVDFAHKRNKKCHIGKCGTLDRLVYAREIGADSVDSTSWVRNDSWHIVEEFYKTTYTSKKWEDLL
jgi:hypothetical protein